MAAMGRPDDPSGWAAFLEAADAAGAGATRLLSEWLEQEIDEHGLPRQLPVVRWWEALAALDAAVERQSEPWSDDLMARVEALFRSALRWSRPGGGSVFTLGLTPSDRGALALRWAERLADPSLQTVALWWFGSATARLDIPGPPPLPAKASSTRALAILRADWRPDGDFLAVEQDPSDGAESNRLELVCSGSPVLGPHLRTSGILTPPESPPIAPIAWSSGPLADRFEWESGAGRRTAVLFRGRRLALVAQHVPAGSRARFSFDLAPGVVAEPRPGAQGVIRLAARRRVKIDAIPLSQTNRESTTRLGDGLTIDGATLQLDQHRPSGGWVPLLLSWDAERGRRRPSWRPLTVTERSRVCGPEEAFAARVSWGQGESLLVYRSHGPTALRAVLGHPTSARLLVGLMDETGDLRPLVQYDGE